MRRGLFGVCRREIAGALLTIPIAMVGVALPLGFVIQVDAYLKYYHPIELATVYAWGWVISGFAGFVLAVTALVPVMGAAWLLRQSLAVWAERFGAAASLSIMALAFLKATKLWLQANEFVLATWMGQAKWVLVVSTVVGCVAWILRREKHALGLRNLATLGALAGLIPLGIAVLTTWAVAAPPAVTPLISPTAVETMAEQANRPNVILLTVDTLAADHMSLYGYGRQTTPTLERLARQASVFERFYANSNFTPPSVNSIIHGLRPWSHRVLQHNAKIKDEIADRNLVARMKEGGYQTFAVATNPSASPSSINVSRWLDQFAERRYKMWFPIPAYIKLPPYAVASLQIGTIYNYLEAMDWFLFHIGVGSDNDHYDPELSFSAAKNFIVRRNLGRPFFLWVHLFPPHDPYATPPMFLGRFDNRPESRTRFDSIPPQLFNAQKDKNFPDRYLGRYDESIAYMDYHVGRFVDWLKDEALFDENLLVISADHGESFVKGYGGHGGPLLHDALIRVPLVLKQPGQRIGRRLNVLAEQIDLMPTILDLAGVGIDVVGEGRSLKPAIWGEKMEGAVFSMNFQQNDRFGELRTGSVAMIEGYWKYIHYRGQHNYPNLPQLEDSLYDLELDPGEEENLIHARPAVAWQMLTKIQEKLRQHAGTVN